ncbi:NtaA/DmoA family FMN-dependent monooxygenase [Mycobacterium sp. TNTM28]|uniref:NtaA/DmoA family FMN-dependent monooxygenase n=1 Tax=[Mycobacterium] fortunisiensis TaxID=2600579 RepID=A0ABS6KKK0_9MYCO|nr:NtaA/DmoA family FMN-dependent monooxygenase [[Mycobacterium] fortunisiensis]MBU9764118.1 NtaA/DmoA family FMN-dependent monooxygenase [[Mycobacterium] fortunisiensis]
MTSTQRYLHLNLVANDINLHQGAYGYEQAHGIAERSTFERLLEYGRFGDEGLFTALFVGDIPGMQGSPAFDGGPAEPITALTAIAQHTKHVGLIATASTTFYDPYNLARLLASLDQASDGRAGYNAVTSVIDDFALNYSLAKHLDREERYQRADEFLDVLRSLWDNRELRRDPDGRTRFYAEPINHRGTLFQVSGPLNVAPSRQGRPLIAQAGGSGAGIKVAAKHAEMVFTNSSTRESAAVYRETLDKALVEQGRTPGSVPPIPGLIPYVGKTTKDAEERLRELDSYVNWEPIAPFALGQFGIEVPLEDINAPFPVAALPVPADVEKTIKSTFGNYVGLYNWIQERPGVTVRDVVAQAVGRGGATHRKFVGSYDDLVEDFAAWHEDGNVGGFNLMFSAGAESIQEFIDEVVPRLIDRGIYRSTPADQPLRERF